VIPVLLLTGFLGSGKTTLLRHLLRHDDFSRTAVIINEFGEVGLDHELVEASEDSFVTLSTGCLCCKVRDDLARTLAEMLRRRDDGSVPPFTRIVIETSGLADPAPILQTLMTDEALSERLALAGVATTVDAVTGAATLERERVSVKQVAVADRLIVTKTDLIDMSRMELLDRLAALNAAAPLLEAEHGKLDPHHLFDAGPFDPQTKSIDVQSWLAREPHAHGTHNAEIKSYAIVRASPMRAVALTLLLETLAEHCGADLLRLKGIVNVAESPERPAVIHGVQHVFHAPAWLPRWPSEDHRSRIVAITRNVPQRWIEALIDALDAEVAEVAPPLR
jgi:G3E family GTPase